MNPYDYIDRMRLLHTQQAKIRERFGLPTLNSTLKIDGARMIDQTLEARAIAEVKFQDWKCPDTREKLLDCLSEILNECNALSIPFPAIFLLRQRQLLDGDFLPERRTAPLFDDRQRRSTLDPRKDGRS